MVLRLRGTGTRWGIVYGTNRRDKESKMKEKLISKLQSQQKAVRITKLRLEVDLTSEFELFQVEIFGDDDRRGTVNIGYNEEGISVQVYPVTYDDGIVANRIIGGPWNLPDEAEIERRENLRLGKIARLERELEEIEAEEESDDFDSWLDFVDDNRRSWGH